MMKMKKTINDFHFKTFDKKDRSSFSYWYMHWKAFNLTAYFLGAWKFKYLFHDFEKPWLKLFWPYEKVQAFHRKHANHHVQYAGDDFDWEAMVIDWECSRFTKSAAQLNAADTLVEEMKRLEPGTGKYQQTWLYNHVTPVLKKFGLIQ